MENKKLIDRAIEYIQANPKENLSLQCIADNAGFSLTYFDAIFQKHTGYSPVEYARIYKLTRSALALRRTDKTILDIALDFGYQSPESFARAFKGYYSMSPSEYRDKYADEAVTWHDLSGKIAISHFMRMFPELKPVDIDLALDYCFTHNPLRYAEDIIGMTVSDAMILTTDTTELKHFICVSEYAEADAFVNIVCDSESDALSYVKILSKNPNARFFIRKPLDCTWDAFDAYISQLGMVCTLDRYDMIYPKEEIEVPEYSHLTPRELTIDDMPIVRQFKERGGCGEEHVLGLKIAFEKKGNLGERAFGLFIDNEMVCLVTPVRDVVRELDRYDLGAVFAIGKGNTDGAIDCILRYSIYSCIKDGSIFGSASEKDIPIPSPTNVALLEKMGFEKVAEYCCYKKQ